MQIIERDTLHLAGLSLVADLRELPVVVPALWRRVFNGHEESDTVFAELSEEPGGSVHRITVGILVAEATEGTIEVPGGPWLHHEHRGPVQDIGASYAAMFAHAAETGVSLSNLKLDVGYLADGTEAAHDLYLQLA